MSDRDFDSFQNYFSSKSDEVFEDLARFNSFFAEDSTQNKNNIPKSMETTSQLNNTSIFNIEKGLDSKKKDKSKKRSSNKKKDIIVNGPEVKKMKANCSHYNENFLECKVYKGSKEKNHKFFNQLGSEYNNHFKEMIKYKEMPKFTRYHKRNFGLAVWFFEDNLPKIYNWLVSSESFSF